MPEPDEEAPKAESQDWEKVFKSYLDPLGAAYLFGALMSSLSLTVLHNHGIFDGKLVGSVLFVLSVLFILFLFWGALFFLSSVWVVMNQNGIYYFRNRIRFRNSCQGYTWNKISRVRTTHPWGGNPGAARIAIEGGGGRLDFNSYQFTSQQLQVMFRKILEMKGHYPHIRIEEHCSWLDLHWRAYPNLEDSLPENPPKRPS